MNIPADNILVRQYGRRSIIRYEQGPQGTTGTDGVPGGDGKIPVTITIGDWNAPDPIDEGDIMFYTDNCFYLWICEGEATQTPPPADPACWQQITCLSDAQMNPIKLVAANPLTVQGFKEEWDASYSLNHTMPDPTDPTKTVGIPYEEGDMVEWHGSLFYCLNEHLAMGEGEAPEPDVDDDYWELMVRGGGGSEKLSGIPSQAMLDFYGASRAIFVSGRAQVLRGRTPLKDATGKAIAKPKLSFQVNGQTIGDPAKTPTKLAKGSVVIVDVEGPDGGRQGALFSGEGPKYFTAAYQHNKAFAKPGPYITTLSSGDETSFRSWVTYVNGVYAARYPGEVLIDADQNPTDYDYRGYWKHAATHDGTHPAYTAGSHFPDTWKTPYDTTFSSQSKWAIAGTPFTWHGDNLIDDRDGSLIFGTVTKSTAPTNKQVYGLGLILESF